MTLRHTRIGIFTLLLICAIPACNHDDDDDNVGANAQLNVERTERQGI